MRVLQVPGRRRHWTRGRKSLPTCPRLAPSENRDIVAGQVSACVAGESATMLSPVVYAVPAGGSGRLPREEVLPRPDLHVGLVLAETWSVRTAVLSPPIGGSWQAVSPSAQGV